MNRQLDLLAFCDELRGYLKSQIELSGPEPTHDQKQVIKVKITSTNTAPDDTDWPKVVFTGVGLSIAQVGQDTGITLPGKLGTVGPNKLISDVLRKDGKGESPSLDGPPWQNDDKFETLSRITFNRTDSQPFPEITEDERKHGEALFPGESITYEMDVPLQMAPDLQLRVEGTVSRRHLLHYQETFSIPLAFTKPLALAGLRDFDAIDIHKTLASVIASMPKFDSDTRLAEVQTFSTALSIGITEIKATQEALKNVFSKHNISWFHAHIRAAFICLDRVSATLTRTKEAIGSNAPEKIAAEISAIMALQGEAAYLNRTTQELLRKYNISDEEANYKYRGL